MERVYISKEGITDLPSFKEIENCLIERGDYELIKKMYNFVGELLEYEFRKFIDLIGEVIK